MKKIILALLLCLLPSLAQAATCTSYPFTLQNNTTADATQVMSNFNTVRNCVVNNAAGNGVNTDITSLLGLTTPLAPSFGGSSVFIGGTSTGSANAQVVSSVTPTGFALTSGYRATFTAGATNTGATTLNISATGATTVQRVGHAGLEALTGGEIVSGNIVEAIYNGTVLVLLNSDLSGVGTRTGIATGATVDLGTVATHNASITSSGGTITSFGSSAVVTDPVYLISFAGINTLTYNATSLIIPGAANITTAANDTAVVEYLGSGNWQVLSYTKASGAGVVAVTPLGGASAYVAANNSGTPNTSYDMAASSVVMISTAGVSVTANSVSVTVNATVTGANGLDAGSLANSTVYYSYFINNGTTTAGLLSTSATAPTMPSGYTYKTRLGSTRTDGSANFLRIKQVGELSQYVVTAATNTAAMPQIATGTAGSASVPTWVALSTSAYVPATAKTIRLVANTNNGAATGTIVAPNNSYGGNASTTNPPPLMVTASSAQQSVPGEFVLESTSIYWASNGGAVYVLGWRDAVNAN